MSEERKKPFSTFEKDLFLNILYKYEHILVCKKTNATCAQKKKESWDTIVKEFNSSDLIMQKVSLI